MTWGLNDVSGRVTAKSVLASINESTGKDDAKGGRVASRTNSRQRMGWSRHHPGLGLEAQARKGRKGMTTSESSALNLSCGQFGRAARSVIATV